MAATDDPRLAAAAAGLTWTNDEEPGIRRVRCGKGFRYLTPDGSPPPMERIRALVVPPAWTDVWICPDPDGHIQATGRDLAGRKQYRYHDVWRVARDQEKFDSLHAFGRGLTDVRRAVAADLHRRGMPRERVLALVVRLLDETLIRIGNPQYAARESYGLTTLQAKHLELDGGAAVFEFTGKHQVDHRVEVDDSRLARLIAACDEVGGEQLFCYLDEGEVVPVTSDDVNSYLRELAGPLVTARDFRTWGGTVSVVEALGGGAGFLEAVDLAAERLGNTRDVCRRAYVHPVVEEAADDGRLRTAWRAARRTKAMTRAERATLRVLDPAS